MNDMMKGMASQSGADAGSAGETRPDRLTSQRFAERFQDAWRALWCIAAAVTADRTAADDILQEAAVVALGKLEQFDPATNFTAWMGKIVRFIALNHGRRRQRTATTSVDPHSIEVLPLSSRIQNQPTDRMPDLTEHGQLETGTEAFDDRVLGALRTLEETARACLLLRTLQDMPYRDIALALDIAEGTAMSHVHRARMAMRERLAAGETGREQASQAASRPKEGDDHAS
jgi:RNA polymerase sigma-70 factor, ECF subfamily